MKFFAKQIVTKIEFGPNIAQIENRVNNYPKVEHFLYVVDVADDMTRVRFLNDQYIRINLKVWTSFQNS